MSDKVIKRERRAEVTKAVAYCSSGSITIAGAELKPDARTAFIEFNLARSFPVVTCDGTALYPQVVANSFQSMQWKVFNLAHLMRNYDPKKNPRDRILGTVVAVELAAAGGAGIRAVACVHRAAEQAEEILMSYFNRTMSWAVSMEDEFFVEESGFLLKAAQVSEEDLKEDLLKVFVAGTPEDLVAAGYVYVPWAEAPLELMECFDDEQVKIVGKFGGQAPVILLGGLSGSVFFQGVGLTPMGTGKEPGAEVSRMLAGAGLVDVEGVAEEVADLLRKTAALPVI